MLQHMKTPSRNCTIVIIASVIVSLSAAGIFAQDEKTAAASVSRPERKKGTVIFGKGSASKDSVVNAAVLEEKDLSGVQQQARLYRAEGFKLQEKSDLDGALVLYQKAAEMDPGYAIVCNDLGIIYEAKGAIERAEESYLRAIQLDKNFLSAYSNLALLYEGKRDLEKAAYFWKKRVELGVPADPWTQKAQQRYDDTRLALSIRPQEMQERSVVGLAKDIANQKGLERKDNKQLAKSNFEKAKVHFERGDEVTALKLAVDAKQLDPTNLEIQEFVDKILIRQLSK